MQLLVLFFATCLGKDVWVSCVLSQRTATGGQNALVYSPLGGPLKRASEPRAVKLEPSGGVHYPKKGTCVMMLKLLPCEIE